MKAARFYGPRDVRVDEVVRPAAGRGEVLIRVLVSNMCGTDLKTYLRGHPLIRPPVTMGHEYVGEVIETGAGVYKFRKGERIIASNSCPCFRCAMCRSGNYTLCETVMNSLVGFTVPGSYSEYMVIPPHIVARNTYHLPSTPSIEEFACAEPLASVIHALEKVPVRTSITAAILGTGALGLMFLQLLKSRGAKVIMMNRSPGRLKVAERLGADHVLEGEGGRLVDEVKRVSGGAGPDLVVEAVGRKETWEDSFRMVRRGGTVMMFGGCSSGTAVSFDAEKLHYGEITVLGSFHHEPTSFKSAIQHIRSGKVDMKPILTKRLPLVKIGRAFELMQQRDALKISINP